MTMFSILFLAAAASAPSAPTELALASTSGASAAMVEAAAAPAAAPEKVCRTRFVVGQGLVNGMKTRKVCRTRAEWKAAGVDID